MINEHIYLCPKCGSSDWTFPNPLKVSESMMNNVSMVRNLCECNNCGYVGVFFDVDKDNLKEIQKKFKK